MKKLGLMLVLLPLLCLGIVNCKGKTGQIRMATGDSTGTYYAFGSAVAQILSEKIRIPIIIQSTGASKANIELIDTGGADIALAQNDVMDYAWRGDDFFDGKTINSFLSMAALYAEVCHVVVNPTEGIRTIADLKGKNVSVGDAGSGTEINARQILEAYGVTFNDINKQNLDFGASAAAFKKNEIDAFFCVAGIPMPAIVDLADSNDIKILGLDDAHAAQLMGKYPFYTRFSIPGETYWGQMSDVQTVAVKAAFIVSSKLSDDTVYKLTKALFENKALIEAAHSKGKELSGSSAAEGVSVPFHPGAEKYLKEIGAL